ncbi:MAG TPA: S8/S53 family peptidase [Actinomycetota bacterium]|nr:S8/S53 family peptidase [Actinomycetota bacterium]
MRRRPRVSLATGLVLLALIVAIEPTRAHAGGVPAGDGSYRWKTTTPGAAKTGPAVVALIDAGVNPYSPAFRDRSPLAYKHPSTYIPGYPKDAVAVRLSLDLPFEEALAKDEDKWALLARGKLYWFPGTRVIGGISFGAGGCPSPEAPPPTGIATPVDCKDHVILDDNGHGTMTASRAAGFPNSLAPSARIVEIEGLGAGGVRWAAEQGWIDVQSNSWLSLVPPPVPQDTTDAFAEAAAQMVTIAASGNGTAFVTGFAPTPTYLLSTAPAGVILAGAHDNGMMTLWSGAPAHLVADGYAGMSAIFNSSEAMRPDPIACCSSAAAPYVAGGYLSVIQEARRILGQRTTGITGGIVACGREGLVEQGPLADGVFTLEELTTVVFNTAESRPLEGKDDGEVHWSGEPRAPEVQPYGPGDNPFCVGCTTTPIPWSAVPQGVDQFPLIGYGAVNERSVELALQVLRGEVALPERPTDDAQYDADQAVRAAFVGGADAPALGSCPATSIGARG